MSVSVVCRGSRRCLAVAILALAVALPNLARADGIPPPEPEAATDQQVIVHINQAKLLKLPERTATLVVGNPLIADAVVQPGEIVVVTAKSYGRTNLVALDRSGATLMERSIQVVGPEDKVVVIYRGINRETYSCVTNCEQSITVGDVPAYFGANLTQVGTLNALAQQQLK